MLTYKLYRNDKDINKILDNINTVYKDTLCCCHGKDHALFVVDKVEYILKSLSCDERTIELGKIAALLHDIGNIGGRWEHARKSVGLASVFLDNPPHILPEERELILQAIEDHSKAENISSAISAALLIADKMHISKQRILPLELMDSWHKNLLEVEEVKIKISNKNITINCVTTESFSKQLLLDEYPKALTIFDKAAAYLGCSYQLLFNGT
ncbi:MAG: HD domain-containing protein [Defluviitaleaceae bacterium]|nr:HD domain-containing protein [Defluviitaleaceae bacterium]